jgi:tetratricopeptide (TPR) repeat protein
MMCQPFPRPSAFTSLAIACAFLGITTPFLPNQGLADEGVPAPDELNQGESRTNELQKILQAQETLLNTVNQIRVETETAARLHAEGLEKLRQETATATQRTRDELLKSSGALEHLLARQFESEVDILQKMNRSTVLTFSSLIGLGLMAFVGVSIVLWRAMKRMSEPRWAQAQVAVGSGDPIPAALADVQAKALPGMSGDSNDKALPASLQKLEKLEKRILQLESEAASARVRSHSGKPASESLADSRARRDTQKKESGEVKVLLEKGQGLLKSGQVDQALDHFVRAIQAGPVGGEPYVWKAAALEQMGQLEEALAAYNEAIAAFPAWNTAYLRKGALCNRLGRMDEAFQSFEKVLSSLGQP